ncbi:uncharacterized protein LOC122515409 isoform X2 [Polistes fuscatus]|uniref:uncharacterized protein LOC122515409 isoform X2 n=1 Tax=Polistes fuscatus TaxID=30207 RepID=UPI001CA9A44B|nr:uncharacterized protein LOC122515409 isoform X2 [Polistes fuscatus]
MVKYCAFISCKSGSKSERKKYNDINIQQTSLHKIPKVIKRLLFSFTQDPNKLKQLSLGLCQDLVPEKYVCELHFHNKDILKSDNILLPNSVIHTSSKEKIYIEARRSSFFKRKCC